MKLRVLWVCTTAVLMAVSKAEVDVERTVQQVQNILQANLQLPRLSRDEIIQLLNDIRAEDAKSKSSSTEYSKEIGDISTTPYNINALDVNTQLQDLQDIQDNIVADEQDFAVSVTVPTTIETSTKSEPSVMVVLPYTPRDGSSLQELYTRPPRVEVVPESKVTPKPLSVKANEKLRETLRSNAKFADKQKLDIPSELQAFLDSHGLKGKPGQDHFLLPLEGFKPLPPAKVIDGSVQLPENILLSYDLIAPNSDSKQPTENAHHSLESQSLSANNFLYEPLRPEFPFELDTSSTEMKKSVLPFDMPKRTLSKPPTPNYQPIDYDSVKVIPLHKGPNPLEDERIVLDNDLGKRQTNITIASQTSVTTDETTAAPPDDDPKEAITNAPSANDSQGSDTDSGASIADLEDSFGGAAPELPGDSQLPPPRKNGFYWMADWNSFLEVGDGDTKVNIRFEPKLGDPQMFLPVNVP